MKLPKRLSNELLWCRSEPVVKNASEWSHPESGRRPRPDFYQHISKSLSRDNNLMIFGQSCFSRGRFFEDFPGVVPKGRFVYFDVFLLFPRWYSGIQQNRHLDNLKGLFFNRGPLQDWKFWCPKIFWYVAILSWCACLHFEYLGRQNTVQTDTTRSSIYFQSQIHVRNV